MFWKTTVKRLYSIDILCLLSNSFVNTVFNIIIKGELNPKIVFVKLLQK